MVACFTPFTYTSIVPVASLGTLTETITSSPKTISPVVISIVGLALFTVKVAVSKAGRYWSSPV